MTSLDTAELTARADARLAAADTALDADFPGDHGGRQPVHTVYVPADRFHDGLVGEWGAEALAALDQHAPTAAVAAEVFGLDPGVAGRIAERVRAKLASEPIEDLRIDFEDGYGTRVDADEDAAVDAAVPALWSTLAADGGPAFSGIRMKSLEKPTRARGIATLARFVEAVVQDSSVPTGFVVTLPKVTSVDQVEAMVALTTSIEQVLGLCDHSLRFEIQVETPQAILGPDGTALVARMIHAADRRCTGLHYGTYDYSASCGIAAAHQSMEHPAADHAKATMQVAAAGTGVRLSDGSTNVIPVGDETTVHAAWRNHTRLVRRSLERGYYQGWDMHPAHLPSRYFATYAFYRGGLDAAATRLRNYVGRVASDVMDEPATARALADYLARALDCGATDDDEIHSLTDLPRDEILRLAKRLPQKQEQQ